MDPLTLSRRVPQRMVDLNLTLALHSVPALILLAGPILGQSTPPMGEPHWMTHHSAGLTKMTLVSDGVLFTPPGFTPDIMGLGDSIRRCYGTDTTQGGANQKYGQFHHTWLRISQGYGPAAANQAAELGLVSVMSASESSLAGDACFSPWLASTGNTGGHAHSAATIFGQWGAPGTPVPFVWTVVAQWASSTTGSIGVGGQSLIGQQPGPVAAPLLANLIFELQGPLNASDHQYFLATTREQTGDGGAGAFGTGGVTNGNASWGAALYGASAGLSGAISHSRITAYDDPAAGGSGAFTFAIPQLGPRPGRTELVASISMYQSSLWGIQDGDEGAGGNDWRLSTAPVSLVDLRLQDMLSGAQSNPADAMYDPCLIFNQPIFIWSATTAASMLQLPVSWDDLGGVVPPQPGSIQIGPIQTSRHGPLLIPANFDTVSVAALGQASLSVGTPFTTASSLFGAVPATYFDAGITTPLAAGVSHLSAGSQALVAAPKPGLAGAKLGIAAIGLQVDGCTGASWFTEVANSLEIDLQ